MIVKAQAAFPATVNRGWRTRRYKKCTQSILHCLALAFPAQPGIMVTLDINTTFGIDNFTYIVEFPEDSAQNQIDLFVRLAKQIKNFYAVIVTNTTSPVTIPA
jgi:hypothetical protein